MKKFARFLIVVLILCVCLCIFTACDDSNDVEPPVHTHSFTKRIETDSFLKSGATCTQKSVYYYSCECGERSGDTFETGDKNPHIFLHYVSDNNATFETDGTKTALCEHGCGQMNTIIDDGSKLTESHIHKFDKKNIDESCKKSDATCTQEAVYYYSCECGEIGRTVFTQGDKKCHVFKTYIFNNDAECGINGTESAYCVGGCGESHTREKENSALSHLFTCYVSDNNATYESDGTKTAFCNYGCGKSDIVVNEGSKLIKEDHRKLIGKTIVNFGDSIFGNMRPPNDISTVLADITGATVYNCGFGGCRMGWHSLLNFDAFCMYRLADAITTRDFSLQEEAFNLTASQGLPYYFAKTLELLKSIDFSTVDIITIAYGTNDFTGGLSLDNESNKLDTSTIAGALRYSLEKLSTSYPHLKIFVCLPTYRFWMNSDGVFIDDSDTRIISGRTLVQVCNEIEETAEEYHVKVIDNYNIGINKYNKEYYFPKNDGTHPNENGVKLLAQHIANYLY